MVIISGVPIFRIFTVSELMPVSCLCDIRGSDLFALRLFCGGGGGGVHIWGEYCYRELINDLKNYKEKILTLLHSWPF